MMGKFVFNNISRGIKLVTTELKGKEPTFEYRLQDDRTLLVTDRGNPEISYVAPQVKKRDSSRKWTFAVIDKDGNEKQRYVTEDTFKHPEMREKQEDLPAEIKKGRNNFEATMKGLKSGWNKKKIRYRKTIRRLTALSAKAIAIQTRRIFDFCLKFRSDLPNCAKIVNKK